MSAATTVVTLRPGAPGTKRLSAQYGHQLICVRYCYDKGCERRLKTVELIIEETRCAQESKDHCRDQRDQTDLVHLRIGYQKRDLQRRVRQAGERRKASRRVWEIDLEQAIALGLANRIVK
jgi:hypothetical protein